MDTSSAELEAILMEPLLSELGTGEASTPTPALSQWAGPIGIGPDRCPHPMVWPLRAGPGVDPRRLPRVLRPDPAQFEW